MAPTNHIKVLTVDDHAILRRGIVSMIEEERDMQVVAEASNSREAVLVFRQYQPDVTVMDLQLPDLNGIDTLALIRQEFPNARVIVLTTYEGDVLVRRALRAGAAGYILKS